MFVYSNPTVRQLANYVNGLVLKEGLDLEGADVLNARMAAMCSIEEMEVQVFPKLGTVHSSETQSTDSTHRRTSVHSRTVLLRGTTEQFGVHILAQLLQRQNMVVYTLN